MAPPLPSSADDLLASAAPRGRELFRFVRALLDDLEQAAPWSALYAPPATSAELHRELTALVEIVDRAPERVTAEIDELTAATTSGDEREALHEAEFYFTALHQMVAPEIQRLKTALDQMPAGDAMAPSRADYYCELGADLKGKYASSIMGAAAALVSEGRWYGWEVEAILFPEKAEEAARNQRLLSALDSAVISIDEATRGFPWRDTLASWRRQVHVDRYGLGDLVALRAHLLKLLIVVNRRALYSGDYHQLQGREILLGSRLRELESLHLRSLDIAPGTQEEAADEVFSRLHHLLLEVAALLDVDVLRELIGDEVLRDLRLRRPDPIPRENTAGRLDALALLVVDEDLKMFLKLLLSAVKKRSSIAHRDGLGLVAASARREPKPATVVERRSETRRVMPAPKSIDPLARRQLTDRLSRELRRLTHPHSPSWRSFLMVQKLQTRLRVVPPALMAEMTPFLSEVESELLPLLDAASAVGAVPPGAAETLRGCHRRLSQRDLTTPDSALEIGGDLARVTRLLDSLEKEGQARIAADLARPLDS